MQQVFLYFINFFYLRGIYRGDCYMGYLYYFGKIMDFKAIFGVDMAI